jgi:hypothetical protein
MEAENIFDPHAIHPPCGSGVPGPAARSRTQQRGRDVSGNNIGLASICSHG